MRNARLVKAARTTASSGGGWGRCAFALAVIGALAVPRLAAGSSGATQYYMDVVDHTFEEFPLAGGTPTPITTNVAGDGWGDAFLPFPVNFFGTDYFDIIVSTDGYAAFGPASTAGTSSGINYGMRHANKAMPDPETPNQMIALWWDDHTCPTASGSIQSQTLGTAPNRTFVIQWACYKWNQSTTTIAKYQLWLREGITDIEVRYGTVGPGATWTASLGIEDATGKFFRRPLTCDPSCTEADFPTNTSIIYYQGPDLEVVAIDEPEVIYAGVEAEIKARVRNVGRRTAPDAQVRFWFSKDDQLSEDDIELGIAPQKVDIDSMQEVVFSLRATIPEEELGDYYLIAEANPLGATPDQNESNDVLPKPVEMGSPGPDLEVLSIDLPQTLAPGSTEFLTIVVRNRGNLPAIDVPYAVVASNNDVISASDRRIHRGTVSVDLFAESSVRISIEIPHDLPTGPYYFGVILDPEEVVFELDKSNNLGVTESPVIVAVDGLSVSLPSLPTAEHGARWCVGLGARGGDGFYSWSLVGGELPPGLAFDVIEDAEGRPMATSLCGIPSELGLFEFTLQLESNRVAVEHTYRVQVVPSGSAPQVGTSVLPTARLLEDYEGNLLAVGGTAPYEWSLVEGRLPPGLTLLRSGKVIGAAEATATLTLGVEVRDANGLIGRGTVELEVVSSSRLNCVTKKLGELRIDRVLEGRFIEVAGGSRPYTFSTQESRRLSDGAGDAGQTYPGKAPPGLMLASNGEISGAPTAAGSYLWIVGVQDDAGVRDSCSITFRAVFEQGLSIVTTAIADSFLDLPYHAQLQQRGGEGKIVWTLENGSALPNGLVLQLDGRIEGRPSAEALEGQKSRTFPFVVVARDEANRRGRATLSITVSAAPPSTGPTAKKDDAGGCQAAAAGPSLIAAAGALAWIAARRRRQSA